jgi:tetratricopeptide (TPR) repeat protein
VVDLDRALKLDPRFFEAYLSRASYYHAKGRTNNPLQISFRDCGYSLQFLAGAYTEGIEDCNEALRLEPTSIRAHLLRGACKCKLHQYGLAIQDFTKAIQLDKVCFYCLFESIFSKRLLTNDAC